LTGVLFACVAGIFFGAMNITMRRGLARVADVDAGSAVIAVVAFVLVAVAAVASGIEFDAAELWPFLLLGTLVPGFSQLLVVHAVQAAGASRAGILFGMAPLFSALIAIAAFDEPLRWPLVAGTLLVVAGGVALAWEGERPVDYRAYGAALAVGVAAAFGLRDNVARAVSEDVAADPLAQSTAILFGASIVLMANLLRQPSALPRLRAAFAPFASSGVVTALAQVTLFEALDRMRVTVVAPLVGTGVLWTVVFAAIFLGRSELIGRRLVVVALLVVAGGALVGATR
jgi:drug/metabolite transporter (DMT)-like permease